MKLLLRLAALLLLALPAATAHAEGHTVCVYDPAGRTGFMFGWLDAWRVSSAGWGADVTLKPYTDEATAVNDFTAGKCDGVATAGVRLQKFNPATYTVEAAGGLSDYALQKRVLQTLQTKDTYRPMFTSGSYETVGIYPMGAVYVFTRNRTLDTLAEFAGKRVATMDYDRANVLAVKRMGAIAVPVDLTTLGPMFNNGEVDMCMVPATAYTPFELWHGLGDKGGVISTPLLEVTLQILVHKDRFPAGFGEKSRAYVAGQFDTALQTITRAEGEIPAKYWVKPTAEAQAELDVLLQRMRVELRDKDKSYDGAVLSLLKKARCNADPKRVECASAVE